MSERPSGGGLGRGWARREFVGDTLGWRSYRSLHAGTTVLPGSVEGAVFSESFDSEDIEHTLTRTDEMLAAILRGEAE